MQGHVPISAGDLIGYRLLGKVGNSNGGRHLHLLIDRRSSHVEGTTEDVGEADDIIDLIRIIGATGSHQHIRACLLSLLVGDLGLGIGKCKDHRIGCHRAYHLLSEQTWLGKTEE